MLFKPLSAIVAANQLTDFYMTATLEVNGLNIRKNS